MTVRNVDNPRSVPPPPRRETTRESTRPDDASGFTPEQNRRRELLENSPEAVRNWTEGVYREAFGRSPTEDELVATIERFNELAATGMHIWAVGADLINAIKATEEFATTHPYAAQVEAQFQQLYGQGANLEEQTRAQTLIAQVVANGGTAESALTFAAALMRNEPRYTQAHPFGPFIDKLYGDGLGRAPTADELARCEEYINQHVTQAQANDGCPDCAAQNGLKHIFEAGAALGFFMVQSDEFKARHPLQPLYATVYQDNLGRGPSIEEIGKATTLANQMAAEGRNIFEIGQAIQFFIRLGDEYKARQASMAPAPGALGDGQQVQAYIDGVPSTITVYSVGNGEYMREDAARAYLAMEAEARAAGINISAGSGFRTNAEQQHLYQLYLNGQGNLAARPGHSNHQGGISMDLSNVGGYGTAAYRWLQANAGRFGFVNDVGGESWHWTFTG